MGVLARFRGVLTSWREKALTARAECWLIVGLFIVDLGAAIPFGISSSDPNAPLTVNEWISSGLLAILAFIILAGMFNKHVLSWAGLAGGMIWAAVAVGSFHDNFIENGSLSTETKWAIVLLALGIGMAHLSLERHVERPKYGNRYTDL